VPAELAVEAAQAGLAEGASRRPLGGTGQS